MISQRKNETLQQRWLTVSPHSLLSFLFGDYISQTLLQLGRVIFDRSTGISYPCMYLLFCVAHNID